ncbi:hypothetical protein BGE01nite_10060 [Brevifollis gellanilyticus]|uniref:Pyrroline-5-carboxylate reductase catalytic N-terminal domain-containing protein n=2 Tax=Brevifollis gellanilyticus TaxID=748831 RepID=A0A512M4Q1_9BACT|nr:hypothetical protein BGE01nite_10060 [Brevifollis gellanilyticus]
MNIGIIGAGQIGGTLARRLTQLGHCVSIANSRGPETLADLAAESGAAAKSVTEVVRGVDLVIVSIPLKSVPLLPADLLKDVPESVVVVDTGNYYPSFRDGVIEAIESGMTESGWVAKHLGRPVIKAFNSITAVSLNEGALPPGSPGRIAVPVAGDDADSKDLVIRLMGELGFDGLDAGTLDESWKQEPGTPVYATDLDLDAARRALSQANRARSPELRELAIQKMVQLMQQPQGFAHQDLIQMLRSLH